MVLAIVDGADRVGRPLRDIVMHAVDELPVSLFFAEQRVPKTGAVVGICARFSTGEFDERGQDVSVLHERIGAFVGRDTPGPTGDQCGMDAGVPVRPLVTGKLRPLLGGEQHDGVVRTAGGLKRVENLSDLPVHVGDLREVFAKILPRARRVGDVRRELELGRWILRRITHNPRHMRLHQRHDQAERLPFIARHEVPNTVQLMGAGGIAHTIGIKPGDILKGKRRRWLHVHLAGDAHPVTQRAQMVRHALHVRLAGRVVPRAAVVQRILAGHQLGAARLAHRLCEVGAIKRQPLFGQAIDVRGSGILAAVQWQVVVRAVIGHDDEKVGPLGQCLTRLAKHDKKQQ